MNTLEPIVVEDKVDMQEYNRYYDKKGNHIFDQIIYWESYMKGNYDDTKSLSFRVVDWRLIKKKSQLPEKDWKTGKYIAIFNEDIFIRKITSDYFFMSWTQYDPELEDGSEYPRCERRGLSLPPHKN